jgi:hypothetical protein
MNNEVSSEKPVQKQKASMYFPPVSLYKVSHLENHVLIFTDKTASNLFCCMFMTVNDLQSRTPLQHWMESELTEAFQLQKLIQSWTNQKPEVLAAVVKMIFIFCETISRNPLKVKRHFEVTCHLRLWGLKVNQARSKDEAGRKHCLALLVHLLLALLFNHEMETIC